MGISLDHIELIAEWSKLALDSQKKELYMDQINKILERVAVIEGLKIDDIELSVDSFCQINALREDRVRPSMKLDLILQNAPDPQDGMFGVPKILE